MLGKPAKTQRFALKPDEEIWDWRFIDSGVPKVFSVTFGGDARVMSTAVGNDLRETHTGG